MEKFPFRLFIERTDGPYMHIYCKRCDVKFARIRWTTCLYSRFGNALWHVGPFGDHEGWWAANGRNKEAIDYLCKEYPELFTLWTGEGWACPACNGPVDEPEYKCGNDPIYHLRFLSELSFAPPPEEPDRFVDRMRDWFQIPVQMIQRKWNRIKFERAMAKANRKLRRHFEE